MVGNEKEISNIIFMKQEERLPYFCKCCEVGGEGKLNCRHEGGLTSNAGKRVSASKHENHSSY